MPELLEQKVISPLDGSPHQKYFVGEIEVPGASTVAKYGGKVDGMIHRAWQLGQEGRNYREEWDEASQIGDITHAFIRENLDHDYKVDLSHCEKVPQLVETARQCAAKGLWFIQENDYEVVSVEEQLARPYLLPTGEHYGYGGTIDLVVRNSAGEYVLVDWKTSKGLYPIPNYCQIIGYEHLWNYCNPTREISHRVIVRIGKGDGDDYQEKWIKRQSTIDKHWAIFEAQLLLWYRMNVSWR